MLAGILDTACFAMGDDCFSEWMGRQLALKALASKTAVKSGEPRAYAREGIIYAGRWE